MAAEYSGVVQSPDDFFGRNPFPSSDARHAAWKAATRAAETELATLNSEILKTRCKSEAELAISEIRRSVTTFDIMAKRQLQVVWGDANIQPYDRWLSEYSEAWVRLAESHALMHTLEILELRMQLMQRVEFWKAEVRSYVSRQPEELSRLAAADDVASARGAAATDPNPHAQPEPEVLSSIADERKAALAAYKRECRAARVTVTNGMIANAADPKWNDRTPVEKWASAKDPRYNTPMVDRKIRAVFRTKPHIRNS